MTLDNSLNHFLHIISSHFLFTKIVSIKAFRTVSVLYLAFYLSLLFAAYTNVTWCLTRPVLPPEYLPFCICFLFLIRLFPPFPSMPFLFYRAPALYDYSTFFHILCSTTDAFCLNAWTLTLCFLSDCFITLASRYVSLFSFHFHIVTLWWRHGYGYIPFTYCTGLYESPFRFLSIWYLWLRRYSLPYLFRSFWILLFCFFCFFYCNIFASSHLSIYTSVLLLI